MRTSIAWSVFAAGLVASTAVARPVLAQTEAIVINVQVVTPCTSPCEPNTPCCQPPIAPLAFAPPPMPVPPAAQVFRVRPTHAHGTSTGLVIAGVVSIPVGLMLAFGGALANICLFCDTNYYPGTPWIVGGLTLAAIGLPTIIAGAVTGRDGGRPSYSRVLTRPRPGLVVANGGAIGSFGFDF